MVVEEMIAKHLIDRLRDMYGCLPPIAQVDLVDCETGHDTMAYVYHDDVEDGEFSMLCFERPQVYDVNCAGDGKVIARPLEFDPERIEQLMLNARMTKDELVASLLKLSKTEDGND
jgi:hypothetical protein